VGRVMILNGLKQNKAPLLCKAKCEFYYFY
jgi:hypothetical protein